jgi:hypothetical protein
MKEPYTPHAEWRKQFEFKPLYNDPAPHMTQFEHTVPRQPFKLDPILEHYSTQQPTRYVSTP